MAPTSLPMADLQSDRRRCPLNGRILDDYQRVVGIEMPEVIADIGQMLGSAMKNATIARLTTGVENAQDLVIARPKHELLTDN